MSVAAQHNRGNYRTGCSATPDCIFGHVDLAAIERASVSGRGVLNLVEVLSDAVKHMRKDFRAATPHPAKKLRQLRRLRSTSALPSKTAIRGDDEGVRLCQKADIDQSRI
jgi:hypothetical protein